MSMMSAGLTSMKTIRPIYSMNPVSSSVPAEVVSRARELGYITDAEIVDLGISVVDLSRSHNVWLVSIGTQGRFVIKQKRPSSLNEDELAGERQVYELTKTLPLLAKYLPKRRIDLELGVDFVFDYAEGHSAWSITQSSLSLSCDYLNPQAAPPAESINEISRSSLSNLMLSLGKAIAEIHLATSDGVVTQLSTELPWVLTIFDGDAKSHIWNNSLARSTLEKFARLTNNVAGIRHARGAWRSRCLIHGDFKLDNCLVQNKPGSDICNISIIDWELASWGDPAWDLAGVFLQIFLNSVHSSSPSESSLNIPIKEKIYTPTVEMAAVELLKAYNAVNPLPMSALAQRLFLYSGAWLLQTAVQFACNGVQEDLSNEHQRFIDQILRTAETVMFSQAEFTANLLLQIEK